MKYRKKPVEIEAIQYVSDFDSKELTKFCPILKVIAGDLIIPTLEGNMYVSLGDWIIKGVKGEFYPCKPDIFEMTYEPAS